MYSIAYNIHTSKSHFLITIQTNEFLEQSDYQELVNYLSLQWIRAKKIGDDFYYLLPYSRIEEMILRFTKDKVEFNLSVSAIDELKKIRDSYKVRETKFYRNRKFDDSILNEGIKLFDFQKEAIKWRLQRNSYLDAFDCGLGKTVINVCVASTLYSKGYIDGIFLVVPIGTSYHWKNEILDFVNIFTEDDFYVVNNDNKTRVFDIEKAVNSKVIITTNFTPNFAEIVHSYHPERNRKRRKNLEKNKRPKSYKNVQWDKSSYFDLKKLWNKKNIMLINDECHAFKNPESIRYGVMNMALRDYFDYKALLSATPFINAFEDSFAHFSFLDKSIIPMSFKAFRIWVSKKYGNKFNRDAVETYDEKKVSYVLEKAKPIFTQLLKEDVPEMKVKRLPPKIWKLDMTEIQKKLYRYVVEKEIYVMQEEYDKITWRLLLSKFPIIMSVFENPLLLKKRYYNDAELNELVNAYSIEEDPKFILLKNRIEEIVDGGGDKLLIYDYHPETLDTLFKKFKKYNPILIHGQLKDEKDKEKERSEKERLFNNDDSVKLAFLSLYTSSQSHNFNKKCNRTIFYNLVDNTEKVRQAYDRTHRINSTRDSFIEIFNYRNTIENIKVQRALNRIELNDKLGKELSEEDLSKLLNGEI